MSIQFKNNAYLATIRQYTVLRTDERIFNVAKRNPIPETVNFHQFSPQYNPTGWFGRKIIALPSVIWYGCVKTIYQLTKIIFLEAKKKVSNLNPNETKNLQTGKFYLRKDLKESFGWLITLFNDQRGQYVAQASQFERSYYECSISDNDHYSIFRPTEDYYYAWSEAELDAELRRVEMLTTGPEFLNREVMFYSLISNHILINRLDEALDVFKKLKDKPNHIVIQIAEAYFAQGKLDDAFKTIQLMDSSGENFHCKENFEVSGVKDNFYFREQFKLEVGKAAIAVGQFHFALNIVAPSLQKSDLKAFREAYSKFANAKSD